MSQGKRKSCMGRRPVGKPRRAYGKGSAGMAGMTTTLTSKGQITVPADVRRYMELREGDRILFVRDAGRVCIERLPAQTPSAEVFGTLNRPGAAPLDLEQARADVRTRRVSRQSAPDPEEKRGNAE